MMLVDGATFTDLNIDEAISKCRDYGFKDSHIIVDTILDFEKSPKWLVFEKYDTMRMLLSPFGDGVRLDYNRG